MKNFFIKLKDNFLKSIKEITLSRIISYVVVLIASALFFWYGSSIQYTTNEGYQELHSSALTIEYTKVKVLETVDEWVIYGVDPNGNQTEEMVEKGYVYKCKIKGGERDGEIIYAVQKIVGMDCCIIKEVSSGSSIYTRELSNTSYYLENNPDCEFKDNIKFLFAASTYTLDRAPTLIALTLIFVIMLLLFSRVKGFHTLLSLGLACASIVVVYIPAVLAGKNIYFWTIIICLYSTLETLVLLEGVTKKSLCATIGCLSGILVSAIICVIANATMNIIGKGEEINSEEYWITSTYWETFSHLGTIDLRGIIFSSVLFGALGAIMDVSMSLSSSLLEVYNNSSNHSIANTMKSGFNIGRDMLGTMSNTLVLAYLSTSLATMLYYVSHYYLNSITRKEFFALALSQALIGCIGILITIPLTSLICSFVYNKKEEWFPSKEEKLEEITE